MLAGMVWLVGCSVVPEALAVPYAEQLGLDTSAAGMLMAADPAGSMLGARAFMRVVPERLRQAAVGPLAVVLAGLHARSATVHDCEFLPVDAVRVSG